jgi:hypothetical protein
VVASVIYIWGGKKMMKRKMWSVIGILAVLVFVLVGCNGTGVVNTGWSSSNELTVREIDSWSYTASRINGNARRDINFSAEGLSNLYVSSSNGEGSIRLTLSQGDVEETFDISGSFSGYIDTSAFEPGQIRVALRFDNAQDIDLFINWAA